MAKVTQMMGAQQTTTQQIPPTRTGNKVIANSNMMGAQQTTTQQIPPTRTGNKVIANSNMTRPLFETSNTGVALGKKHRVIAPNHLAQAAKSHSRLPFKDGNIRVKIKRSLAVLKL